MKAVECAGWHRVSESGPCSLTSIICATCGRVLSYNRMDLILLIIVGCLTASTLIILRIWLQSTSAVSSGLINLMGITSAEPPRQPLVCFCEYLVSDCVLVLRLCRTILPNTFD